MESQNLEQEINQLASARSLLQYGLVDKQDLHKNVGTCVQMKCRLDNQFQGVRSKASSDGQYEQQKKIAVLYKRLADNVNEQLIPKLVAQDERDAEFKRMLGIVQKLAPSSLEKCSMMMSQMTLYQASKGVGQVTMAAPVVLPPAQSTYQPMSFSAAYPGFGDAKPAGGYPSTTGGGGYGSLANTSAGGYDNISLSASYSNPPAPTSNAAYPSFSGGYPSMANSNNAPAVRQPTAGYPSQFQTSASAYGQFTPQSTGSSGPSSSSNSSSAQFKNPSNSSLKTVVCPQDIVHAFLRASNVNTQNKIETLALLTGKEINGEYHITHLLVPQQTGKQDMCIMEDEMGLFEVQLQHELMTLGWIHTHPQFDVFLSSVDMHNQLGYQSQLPEAVAIVYSPIVGMPPFKALRVKDTMCNEILYCKAKGFHEHRDPQGAFGWEECKHIRYTAPNQGGAKVIDLRR